MALEANTPQHCHLVIGLDFHESLLEYIEEVLRVANKKFFERAYHASRGSRPNRRTPDRRRSIK